MVMTATASCGSGGQMSRPLYSTAWGAWQQDINELVRHVTDTNAGMEWSDLQRESGNEIIHAFRYGKYPYPKHARTSLLKARAAQRRTPRDTAVINRVVTRIKIVLSLRMDGRLYVKVDYLLDAKGAKGFKQYAGRWKFLAVYDLESSFTPGEIADEWQKQGFMTRCRISRNKSFKVIMALRRFGNHG
jgi:hypothetical protein